MATPSDNTVVYESQSVPRGRRKRPKKETDDEEDEEEVKSFYSQVEQVSQEVRTPPLALSRLTQVEVVWLTPNQTSYKKETPNDFHPKIQRNPEPSSLGDFGNGHHPP